MYDDKRSATIIALTECKVWVLDRKTFKIMLIQSHMTNRKIHMGLIDKI